MDIKDFFPEQEKPLDNLLSDGGFCGIFRTIGCVGDSLSSGEMEILDKEGKTRYIDLYEYSWGQFMARTIGSKVYNFSRGGMTAREYLDSFAEKNDFWNPDKACQAYIIALGVNDLSDRVATPREKFCEEYSAIVQRYKEIQPDAKFFFVTMLKNTCETREKADLHAEILYDIAARFTNCYVLDFRKYAPIQDDTFREKFYLNNHLNPCGYILTAKMIMSYIDYIIRHNMDDFKYVGMIGRD